MNKGVFIIAELSANHNHNIKNAINSIKEVASLGADAIKIQTYTADTLTLDSYADDFIIKQGLWKGKRYYDLYNEAFTPWEWHEELFHVAHEEGIMLFSTPFDKTAVDLLESLGNPIYKIASFEITDINLIRYAASKGKPMIISTGIAYEEEIEDAVNACKECGNNQITLLKCTSAYPAMLEDANLLRIPEMKNKYGVDIGLSDHSKGSIVPVVATALGATMIEKHFILDRSIGGPDASFSMDIVEFKQMIDDVRSAEKTLGNPSYEFSAVMQRGRNSSRSLYVAENMKKGDCITECNVRSVRPGFGLSPKYLSSILGKKINQDLPKGSRMKLEYIDD